MQGNSKIRRQNILDKRMMLLVIYQTNYLVNRLSGTLRIRKQQNQTRPKRKLQLETWKTVQQELK